MMKSVYLLPAVLLSASLFLTPEAEKPSVSTVLPGVRDLLSQPVMENSVSPAAPQNTAGFADPPKKEKGFRSLFNGKNLDGWTGNKTDYRVEDGMIVVQTSGGGHGNLYTEQEYGNFIFRFEFLLTPGANNGLGVRAPLEGDAAYVGMELQILDNTAPVYAHLQPYQYHGSVYGVIPAKRGFLKPVGTWNSEEVVLNGPHVKVTLNGHVIVDGNIEESSRNGTMDHKDHPGLKRTKGHIGFLGHGSVVKFRNIRIHELK